MPRIQPVLRESANQKQSEILDAVQKKMGIVPNLISTMAQSPAVANAYLCFSQSLAGGILPAPLRERIALAVGEANGCHYCVSAHSAIGSKAGLGDGEILEARRASAADEKQRAALRFCRRLLETRGHVEDADVESLRAVGYSEGEIGELIAHTALNTFTNFFNNVAGTEVDFPAAPALR